MLRKTQFKFTGFILAGVASFLAYTNLIPHVYILDDALENRHQEFIALFPTSYTFKNGETAQVSINGKAIIINDNEDKRTFRVDYYSSSASSRRNPRSQWLQPYAVTAVDHSVDYIYEDSPATVRTKSGNTSRGVITDRR
ncbi:MAG: hypothetical protein ACRCWR_05065 [Saezia sp.]